MSKPLTDMPFCPCRQGTKNYPQCEEHITEEYYNTFCNSNKYKMCIPFARKNNLLKTPMAWFQKDAMLHDIRPQE